MNPRHIYLVSITSAADDAVTHLPILSTRWLSPKVDLGASEGVIFTSKTGVDALERLAPDWKQLPVLCVGKATRIRAEALGAKIEGTADGYGDELYTMILKHFSRRRWLYARPKVVASDFADRLRAEGVIVEDAIVYETVCCADAVPISVEDDAVLIFTSPSALHCYETRHAIQPGQSVVAIGRTTAKSLPGRPVHLADEPTVAACITMAKQLAKVPQ